MSTKACRLGERFSGGLPERAELRLNSQADSRNFEMRFCPSCGNAVTVQVPQGDHLPRHVCLSCGEIHYLNPKLVVGSIPTFEGRVLLARRAIEPRLGFWTLPAGFMENGETTGAAAIRETREETCAEIELQGLVGVINIAHISQVHLFYLARLPEAVFAPGIESLEVRLFDEGAVPWDEMAFRSSTVTLHNYFADRRRGCIDLHVTDLEPMSIC